LSTFEGSEIRASYNQQLAEYPERCRQFGVCRRISQSILNACVRAGIAEEATDEQITELIQKDAARIDRLCPGGQELSGECGIRRGGLL
jgi:hypothetical protein